MPKKERPDHLKLLPTHADGGILGRGGKCNALKRDGKERCTQQAGAGTDHPGIGACRYHGGNSPSLKRHAAKQAIREMAQELEMEPDEAIRWVVRLAVGTVSWLRNQIEHADEMDADTLGKIIEAYGEERDRLAKASKLAIDAGIAEREVAVMEQEAALFANAIRQILDGIGLSADQRARAPEIVRNVMLALPAAGQTA